jgi:hypothetical protein
MELEMLGGELQTTDRTELTGSLANSIKKLGYEFEWIKEPSDFDKAEVRKLTRGQYRG